MEEMQCDIIGILGMFAKAMLSVPEMWAAAALGVNPCMLKDKDHNIHP